jgi:hypothetical protein
MCFSGVNLNRCMPFPSEAHYFKHPDDQSVTTYRGHSVLLFLPRAQVRKEQQIFLFNLW